MCNTASGAYSFVAGGCHNCATGCTSFVGGGIYNCGTSCYSFVGGGFQNTASGGYSSVAGGIYNCATCCSSFVGGGMCNIASCSYSTVAGGGSNIASGTYSFIGGGGGLFSFLGNKAIGVNSVIVGGQGNTTCNYYSSVLGGKSNTVSGAYSSAVGCNLTASCACTFYANNICSCGIGSFSSCVGIGTTSPASPLTINATTSAKLEILGGTTQNGILLDAVGSAHQFYIGAGINLLTGTGTAADRGILLGYDATSATAATMLDGNNDIRFGVTPSAERMRIFSGGDISIGYGASPTDAGYKLDVNGTGRFTSNIYSTSAYTNTSDLSFIASSNIPGINLRSSGGGRLSLVTGYINANISSLLVATGTSNPTTEVLRIDHSSSALSFYGAATFSSLGTGTVYSNSGTLTNTNPSDERLKTNITPITYGLCEIAKLNPVSYYWKYDEINQGKQYGFIAQDVQGVIPELVKPLSFDTDTLGLDKEAIFTIYTKAIQELKAENDALLARVTAIEGILAKNNIS